MNIFLGKSDLENVQLCVLVEEIQSQNPTGPLIHCSFALGVMRHFGNEHFNMGVPVVLEIYNCFQQVTKLSIEDADWAGMLSNDFSSLWTNSGLETK